MIVGFTGRKRSGKDTAAKVLIEQGFHRLAFADPLKDMLRQLLRFQGVDEVTIERMIEGDLKEEPSPYLNGRSPRHAMQTIGTEWGRELISDSLWVDCVVRAAVTHNKVVVTDVRFPNEVEAIQSLGGTVIRIKRPGLESNDNHPSEVAIDQLPVDIEIANDGSIECLRSQVLKYTR